MNENSEKTVAPADEKRKTRLFASMMIGCCAIKLVVLLALAGGML